MPNRHGGGALSGDGAWGWNVELGAAGWGGVGGGGGGREAECRVGSG